MDEPSAGMDPVARHNMCEAILGMSRGRSVILTTHHLEEVEALAGRVGIMVGGRFRCLGSVRHLKTKFGRGYWLEFRVASSEQKAGLREFVEERFGSYTVEEEQTTFLRLRAARGDLRLSEVFENIEKNRDRLGVLDYAVSQPTLEQVFLNISGMNDDDQAV
eukprot:NODE_1700_length_1089_cov_35.468269_g1385_i0.p1 GENE.NODE_1700_length_1089_cov_35.468269_g1385_i0~~NODE_1700_length_1089_cov_35.468269_g1385_i0.p1  ORF type:complete len:162 (-),score=46.22 NODE_1700_length_1089_cov_35.468269_g1385_i0:110-595(-)